MIKANTTEIEITPALGTVINGEFTCRYATHIADPLYAKALYLSDEKQSLLFIIVDICVMKREFLDPIKLVIERETGIPINRQLIASTHTHSAGSVADLLLAHADVNYRAYLTGRLIQVAKNVCEKAVPAKIAFGKIEKPEHLTCRRYKMHPDYQAINPVSNTVDSVKTNPFGGEDLIIERTSTPDPEVCYIAIKSLQDEWIGLLANYSLHYVGDCPRSTISADYFGCFAKYLRKELDAQDMVVMMSNGTSGEVNIWDFMEGDRYPKEDHAKSKLIGEDIAKGIIASISTLQWDESPRLESYYHELRLSIRPLENKLLYQALATLAQTDYESLTYTDEHLLRSVYAREQVLLSHQSGSVDFPVQCFKIGNVVIGGLGGEFFSSTGIQFKAQNTQYFTICFANDYVGYVPPKAEFAQGGYETWRARSSFLAEDSEEHIRNELMAYIKKKP